MRCDVISGYSDKMKRVLKVIQKSNGITRGGLVEITGLTNMTILKYVTQFIMDGIVSEDKESPSTGGRRASLLEITPNVGYIIGIDIGAHTAKIGVVNLEGKVLQKKFRSIDFEDNCFLNYSLADLYHDIDEILAIFEKNKIFGISIGISGLVNSLSGKINFCPNIESMSHLDIKTLLTERYGLPVYVDTSARCLARAERRFGLAKEAKNTVYVSIGYSIAVGIITNGQIYEGESFAGEIGHKKVLDDSTDMCTCGKYGCLELYATYPMILSKIYEKIEENPKTPEAAVLAKEKSINSIQAALQGDAPLINGILADVAGMVGTALADVMNILNPSLLILGGCTIEKFPCLVELIFEEIKQKSFLTSYQNLEVKQSRFNWEAGIVGSGIRVIDNIFM
jgi:predicted NBD/HSP70 family sugar kinase